MISSVAPFFIVANMAKTIAFYRDALDFLVVYQEPAPNDFFAIVQRDSAMIMLKCVGVAPVPNHVRDPSARWDAYLHVANPDALAEEFAARGVNFSSQLKDTHDGLRGFEITETNGFVLFFGRPKE